jgi:Fe-S-cluster containining protein
MVESLDLFRIARHLQLETAEVMDLHTDVRMVAWGAPILTMRTHGADNSCVFLDGNKCDIEAVKPRACRTYPIVVGPSLSELDLVNRIILKSPERQFHYRGKSHRAGDWADTNMDTETIEYLKMEYGAFQEMGRILARIPRECEKSVLTQMFLNRYVFFDMSEDFLPQYARNMERLKSQLKNMAV